MPTLCQVLKTLCPKYLATQCSGQLICQVLTTRFRYRKTKNNSQLLKLQDVYQFCRVQFGVTNDVACFQHVIDDIVRVERLQGEYAYLDNITICRKDQHEDDRNLSSFLTALKKYNLTINEKKSKYSLQSIQLLGCEIENKTVKPDEERLKTLLNLPPPSDSAPLK